MPQTLFVPQKTNALGDMASPGAFLQRRPLPNIQSNERKLDNTNQSCKQSILNEDKSSEDVEHYWNSTTGTDSWSYPSFNYSDHRHAHDLYYFRPRGPNPFPRRSPKRLPKLCKKEPMAVSNVSRDVFKLDLHIQLSQFASEDRIGCNNSNATECPHNVSKEEIVAPSPKKIQNTSNLHKCPHLEEEKQAWTQVLLEEQLLEIDRMLNEKEVKPCPSLDRFCEQKTENDTFVEEIEINSFTVSKSCMITDTEKSILDFHLSEIHLSPYKVITENCRDLKEICCAPDDEKTMLDLRASYSDYLPKIELSLMSYLAWVNLSYNYFTKIPEQLYRLKCLISLNMRNNPIRELPTDINRMAKLRFLDVSYCKLPSIDKSVFLLSKLQSLDVSYNLLNELHHDIWQLSELRELLVEGNMLGYLPGTILKLNIRTLRCNLNFISRIFWKEMCPRRVQLLASAAMQALVASNQTSRVPVQLKEDILTGAKCPYCNMEVAGRGVEALKPAQELFGVKNLPLLFYMCSQTCKIKFQRSTGVTMGDD